MVQDDLSGNETTFHSVLSNCDNHIYSMCEQNHKHKPKEKQSLVSIHSESDDVCVESGKTQDLNIKNNIKKKDDISFSLKYHMSSVPNTEVNMPRIKCRKCDLQFLKSEYSLHLARIHSHKCNLCDKMFVRVKTMNDHKEIMHKHKMDVTTNVLSFQTNQFQIVKNMPIHINDPQTIGDSRNMAEHSLINDGHILPVNGIGMKNIEGVNKSQTHLNNILFDELDQFIEVHELPTDTEMTSIGIQNNGINHLNELQTNKNNSLIEELSQFIEVNKPIQTNIEINKDFMDQSKNLKNIKNNTQPTQNMSVNEPNHLNKTNINKETNLQVDVKNNVSNFIPVIQQTGMKINRVGSLNSTSSMNITCNKYDTKFASTQSINNYSKVHSYSCNMCAESFVNRRTMISHMQVMHKQSTNIPKPICNNTIIQSDPYFKPDAQIQSNITLFNKSGVQKELKILHELEENIVVDLSNEMEINECVKFEDFDDMQAGKDQINCSKNKGGLPIVPNDEQVHTNNIQEHDQQNGRLNLLHHNIQLQDAEYPCEEKKPVTKHREYVCNLCDSHLSCQSSLKRHSNLIHNINCDYCEKKFLRSCNLTDHIKSTHVYDNENKMIKLQPDNIKKDDLANQAALYQINSNKNNDILSIASIDEQMHENNVLKHSRQSDMLNLLHYNIQLQDTVAYPCYENKPVIKHTEYVCNLCDGHFNCQSSLKRHSNRIHNINCKYCEKKFVRGSNLKNHIKNSCIQKGHIDTSSRPDEILQLQPDNFKKDDVATQAAIYQINYSNNKGILPNNNQMYKNNEQEQNEMINFSYGYIKDIQVLKDVTANPCDEKKTVIKHTGYICHICGGQFNGKKVLQKHSVAIHNLSCPHCSKRFVRNPALAKHLESDHENVCVRNKHDIATNQLDEMIKLDYDIKDDLANQAAIHQNNCSGNKSVLLIAQNERIQDAVANPCDQKKTVIKHTEYICDICGGQFNGNKVLENHSNANHKYNCPHCAKKFVRTSALNKHIMSSHKNFKKLDCDKKDNLANQADICQINCSENKSILLIAQNTRLQDAVANACNEKKLVIKHTGFTCNICGGQFRHNKIFKNHSVVAHTLNCPHCEKKFTKSCNLKNHIRSTHAYDNENEMLKQQDNIKKDDLANQAAIHQINCSNNTSIFPIVPNDEHLHENNVQEHKNPNEILISLPYNIQLQETVAYPYDEKMHVNKLKGFMCNICGVQFRSKSEFNRHTGKDHKYKCSECQKKFVRNTTLQDHIRIMHIQHNENACMEKTDAVTLSQQDEMLKLQPDFIKKDVLAIQAHEHQINCSKSKSILPIVLNDTYTNDMFEYGQQNQTQDVWQENIVSEETVADMSNEMHINKIDKLSDFEDILPTISQTNCSDINDVQEHGQLKEAKNLQSHNYQLHEEVATQSNVNEHKKYICRICDGQYTSVTKFHRHTQFVHKNKCLFCNKKFIRKITLKKHTLKMHGNRKKKQRIETKPKQVDKTSKLQSVNINMENLANREQFNCNEIKCVKPCKNQKLQLCQQEVDDKEQINKYARYVCNICNLPFKSKTELKRHSVRDHKFECLNCEKNFVRKITLENHLLAEHKPKNKIFPTKMTKTHNTKQSESKKLSTEIELICEYCDSQLKTEYDLGYHMLKQHNYKCSLCVKKFVRIGDIERHRIAEHRHYFEKQNLKLKFCCKECNSRFSTDESLQSHIKYAHILMSNRYTCAVCSMTLANNDEFIEHVELEHIASYFKLRYHSFK